VINSFIFRTVGRNLSCRFNKDFRPWTLRDCKKEGRLVKWSVTAAARRKQTIVERILASVMLMAKGGSQTTCLKDSRAFVAIG